MIASGGLYPSLARYFDTFTELSHAGCMSKTRMRECLDGKRDFTRSEKKSIAANIAMKELTKNPINEKELSDETDPLHPADPSAELDPRPGGVGRKHLPLLP